MFGDLDSGYPSEKNNNGCNNVCDLRPIISNLCALTGQIISLLLPEPKTLHGDKNCDVEHEKKKSGKRRREKGGGEEC